MENKKEEKLNEQKLQMSEELISLLDFIKLDLSKDIPTLSIDTNYFLLGALSHKDNDLFMRLDSCMTSLTMQSMYNTWYQVLSTKAISAVKPNRVPSFDSKMTEMLVNAEKEATNLGSPEITSEHVFLAILSDIDDSNKIRKVFNKAGITYGILKNKIKEGRPMEIQEVGKIELPGGQSAEIRMIKAKDPEEAKRILKKITGQDVDLMGGPGGLGDFPGMSKKKKGKGQYISEYCTDLNTLASEGKIDRLVGREREVGEIIRILGRKKKNNAILLGGEGVGKTAIGESIAWDIVHGNVPEFLADKRIVSLDMTALMAGTTLRGMFEERVKGILDDIKADDSYILFMDNIGAILADKGKNDFEISAMLSRALENGEIQVIGTSDFGSYRKTFDKDPSLARRFQKIVVEAPSVKESISILEGLRESYEKYHKVKYSDEAINACVTLADKYISERNLPDSAIDILDEVGAQISLINEPEELKELRKKITEMEAKGDGEQEEVEKAEAIMKYNSTKEAFDNERKNNPVQITKEDILNIISLKTGIPVNNLTSDDKKKLSEIDTRIKEGVIGQDEAIETICRALKRNRIGLHKGGCMYSAICIGKTGVGKCVSDDTKITIRNKKSGEIQTLTIKEFKNFLS